MNKGNMLIESLLLFLVVVLIVNYLIMMTQTLTKIENIQTNYDSQYEEAYK